MNESSYLLAATVCLALAGFCLAKAADAFNRQQVQDPIDGALGMDPGVARDLHYIDAVFAHGQVTDN